MFAGGAKNKDFLDVSDLVKGGFPCHVSRGEIRDLIDLLFNAGILKHKVGDGNDKYGLCDKKTIESILAEESFESLKKDRFDAYRSLNKYFDKDSRTVPRTEIFYRET